MGANIGGFASASANGVNLDWKLASSGILPRHPFSIGFTSSRLHIPHFESTRYLGLRREVGDVGCEANGSGTLRYIVL